jgi:NAD(P)-dependent dehydrogenase (short-subunit alcohol dehydrogenase family)
LLFARQSTGSGGFQDPVDLGLRDRVCVVTGSTGGIGLETVRLLADEGARVVSSGRSHAPNLGEALHVSADLFI